MSAKQPKKYRAGDTLNVDDKGLVLVTDKHRFVKHGRPGYYGIRLSGPHKGKGTWGYDADIAGIQPAPEAARKAILASERDGRRERYLVGQHRAKKAIEARAAKERRNTQLLQGGALFGVLLAGTALTVWLVNRGKTT